MGGVNKSLNFSLLILFSISLAIFTSAAELECIYGVYVQTGSIRQAGTHSRISLSLFDASGAQVMVPNLEDWGLMGPGYNYFETGYLDLFGGKGPCLKGPVCGLNLTSNGSGPYHAWYCEYVEVTTFGVQKQCSQQSFAVEQWLATDREPFTLTAITNNCLSNRAYRGSYMRGLGSARF
ncbi:lipase/lipooxygenase [Striga asiatica]|uniref:Lipase/lipooxygenase n=1 Tax=Striga asiatica TaxID=4170 RepID=A0A5A7P256_STRAF|nr:lipase/lipooxygenase [Striga asiatica]